MKIIATTRKVRIEDKEDFTSGGFQDLTIDVELSKEYENTNNYVTFGNISVPVIEGKVKTPTLTAGICRIGVYGYEGKDKLDLRYSPLPVDVLVKKGSFTDRTAQQPVPTPTEFEKCVDEVRELLKEAKITDGSVTTEKLADEAVTTEKLADHCISTEKIANGSISEDTISDGAISTSKIADASVTEEKINDSSVGSSKIKDAAITNSKLAKSSVKESNIENGAVTTSKIIDGAITSEKLNDGSVNETKINEKAVSKSKLADNSVSTEKIENKAVTRQKLADGCVDDVVLHPEIVEEIDKKAYKTDIPKNITDLINNTHFKEYIRISDSNTANRYVSEQGDKHKELVDEDFFLAYFPNEISTERTFSYTASDKAKKSDNDNEYIVMKVTGTAIGNNEILLDENGEADVVFSANNNDFNYGGTDSYRILIGTPMGSDGFELTSDWDSTRGTETKGDSLLGDKSSANKSYNCHIKKTGVKDTCLVWCDITFQKHERSGLSMKWVTKDSQMIAVQFKVTTPKEDSLFQGLYFISSQHTLLLSANTDLAEKIQIIQNSLNECIKKNESLTLLGEIVFDGTQTETQYEFAFNRNFYNIFIICDELTSNELNVGNIYAVLRGSPSIEMAGNQFIGKQGYKTNGMFRIERFGDFVQRRSENLTTGVMTFGKIMTLGTVASLSISFDEVIPTSGKVSIYYV